MAALPAELEGFDAWAPLPCVVVGTDGRRHGPLPFWRALALCRSLPLEGPTGADLIVLGEEEPEAEASGQVGFGW